MALRTPPLNPTTVDTQPAAPQSPVRAQSPAVTKKPAAAKPATTPQLPPVRAPESKPQGPTLERPGRVVNSYDVASLRALVDLKKLKGNAETSAHVAAFADRVFNALVA
jgi:hypothetical protein